MDWDSKYSQPPSGTWNNQETDLPDLGEEKKARCMVTPWQPDLQAVNNFLRTLAQDKLAAMKDATGYPNPLAIGSQFDVPATILTWEEEIINGFKMTETRMRARMPDGRPVNPQLQMPAFIQGMTFLREVFAYQFTEARKLLAKRGITSAKQLPSSLETSWMRCYV